MLTAAIAALAFLSVALGVTVAGRLLEGRSSNDHFRVARRLHALGGDPFAAESDPGESWLAGVGARLGAWLVPPSGEGSTNIGSRLALAGYRDPSAVLYFTALQLVSVVALAGAAGGLCLGLGGDWKRTLFFAATGGGAGLLAPTFVLTARVRARQRALRNALPDALDIMVLSVEGGASPNAALNWAAEEIRWVHPILGAELVTVQREVQLGLSVGEAFRAFADRCGIGEARDLAAALLQSEKYGASVGKALRAYADAARQDRQMWAEEVAQKASVKIIFPMLLCIFPAIFIVLLGPAAVQMSKLFAR